MSVHLTTAAVELREVLARHMRELEREQVERFSTAWFFLRYLKRIQRRLAAESTARAAEGQVRGLTRFYVDRVEVGSALAERFDEIIAAHRAALRAEHGTSATA